MTEEQPESKLTAEEIEAIRLRAKEVMEKANLNQRQAAHESGIPVGTLSNFINGTYPAKDASNVARRFVRWLDSREVGTAIRKSAPRNIFIQTPTSVQIGKVLAHAQFMPDIAIYTAEPGIGKTEAARDYQRRNNNVWRVELEKATDTVRSLLGAIAAAVGIYDAGSRASLSRSIQERIRDKEGLLIIDEANHCTIEMLDQVRVFYDKCGCGLALLGNDSINEKLRGGKRPGEYAQLTSRVGMRVPHVRKPRKADITALLDLWLITDPDVRAALNAVAHQPGALRAMQRTHRMAQMRANHEDRELTAQDIEEAYRQRQQDAQIAAGVA